jgi:glycosyltransferase involved in cell wall biosynthesis
VRVFLVGFRRGDRARRFQPGRNLALRRAWGIPDDAVVFGFTGRIAAEKNLPLLLQAFAAAKMPDAWLAIIGPGSSQGDLETLAASLGIRDKVIFTGLIEDIAPYYGALDVFAMSSLTEQMPMSLLEAMASGLPAVATDVGDTAAILGETKPRVIVPPGNTEMYTAALRVLGDNPGMREDLGVRNRERCASRYSFERMVSEYRAVFDRALGADAAVLGLLP